jgi:tRNA threonylcarbamoyladenosine biosynthesis protein TsaE
MTHVATASDEETIRFGEEFSHQLKPGDVVALFGDLGAGKTRFVKGISCGLGVKEQVTSPTFVVVNEHLHGKIPLYHFDFYRLRSIDELIEIGFDDYVYGSGICVLEWAEMIEQKLPQQRYDVHIELGKNVNERIFTIEERK